ncbi:hypothetical protein C8R43DRAFT_336009 [Mycena crocata]|nr:hypothetical protein C8R43DRAFT_336009 [Mycena crocata]
MPQNFRERADLTKIIKSILDSYPLGNGILRELLQNSDDASATKQTFILDLRTHPSQSVVDDELVECQGPSLLAVNDTLFSDSDWKAISTLHSSSKTADETKIGKFGIGVRACYHITDNPHFLSGRKLVIFDPHERFSAGQQGGVMIDIPTEGNKYYDQLAAFDNSVTPDSTGFSPGTVVRLPLRTRGQAEKSTIKPTAVDPSVIQLLFHDFVEKELSVVMLFLKHIRYICLKMISFDGKEHFIGGAEIPDLSIAEQRKFTRNAGARVETFRCTVNVTSANLTTVSQVWRVCHGVRSKEETSDLISRALGYNVGSKLADDKLFSHVALAYPIGLPSAFNGRLFTLLPLPIHTGFPIHMHAILALTQDRQSLRNIEETGTGSESRERLLVTWNRSIFDEFLPATWAALLRILVDENELDDIWAAWPASNHGLTSGSSYWDQILRKLLDRVLDLDLPVFPTFPTTPAHQIHVSLSSALVASEGDDVALLTALSKLGLPVVKLPVHILRVLPAGSNVGALKLLHPNSVRAALLDRISELAKATNSDKDSILAYLILAPGTISNAVGLPLVPLVDGSRISILSRWPNTPLTTYTLVTEQEGEVFRDCDSDLVSLSKMSSHVSAVFCSPSAPRIVNVARLDKAKVQFYLNNLFGGLNPAEDEVVVVAFPSKAAWLTRFWKWMGESTLEDKDALWLIINRFHLLPTAQQTLRKLESRILLPVDGPNGSRIMDAWGILGVHFLHSNLNVEPYSRAFQRFVVASNDVPFLIDCMSTTDIPRLDTPSASLIRDHLIDALRSRPGNGRVDQNKRLKFVQLPIFPTRSAALDKKGGNKRSLRSVGVASGNLIFMRVDDNCPVPVPPEHTTFLDVAPSNRDSVLFKAIAGPADFKNALDELGVLEMSIDLLVVQPSRVLDALLGRIIPRLSDLSTSAKTKLRSIAFVPVVGSSERAAPARVIDPRSELASLYKGEAGKLPSGHWGEDPYLSLLQSCSFFQRELTAEIATERIAYLSRSWPAEENPRIFAKAQIFLQLLDKSWSFIPQASRIVPTLTAKWLPIRDKADLAAPATCRDKGDNDYLFDLVLSVVRGRVVNEALRRALGWDAGILNHVLHTQFQCALFHPKNRPFRLHAVITEYSRRCTTLPHEDIEQLKRTVSEHSWIPIKETEIVETKYALVETKYALLRASKLGGRFKLVPQSLLGAHGGQGINFLRRLGCTDSPCLGVLLAELELLLAERATTRISQALDILNEIAPLLAGCSSGDYGRVLVPGKDNALHFISESYFVDHSSTFQPDGRFPIHSAISESLARDLKVEFLSSLELGEDDDDEDLQMGEDFTTRVEGVLKEHHVDYALNEFLANAIDANASHFSVVLDERTFECSTVLAPGLADLQRRPSLLLYSNSKFTAADFRGLRQVGVGGKRSNPDSIGRYGLGALSLFHFSDVVQIVSDDRLLILDPSATHLPPARGSRPRTSYLKRLSDVSRRYPDQLSGFDSVHGFSKSATSYPGTLFRLPLRHKPSVLSSTILRVSDCLNLLNGPYFGLAKDAMYFTCLDRISAAQQPPTGPNIHLWSVGAYRPPAEQSPEREAVFVEAKSQDSTTLSRQLWVVTKSTTPISYVPVEHMRVLTGMGLHESQVGLSVRMALLIEEDSPTAPGLSLAVPVRNRFLFSTLRLPVQTSLSAHISAQFAISSDRRHIRFEPPDKSGHRVPQAEFNNWILVKLIPPLYISSIYHAANLTLSLRSRISRLPRDPLSWWPVDNNDDDSISRIIVQAFYDSVVDSAVPICYTVNSELIAPVDAVFSTAAIPFAVQDILQLVKSPNFVRPLYSIGSLVAKASGSAGTHQLRFVDPSYVKESLESRTDKFLNLFTRRRISIQTIETVLLCLLREGVTVSNLPLIVLADETLGNSGPPIKYVHTGVIPEIFSRHRFVHETLGQEARNLLIQSPNANVGLFDAAGVLTLVEAQIPPQPQCFHSLETQRWIRKFWDVYSQLPGPLIPSRLDQIPLITTANGDHISLEYCRRDDVISEPGDRPALVSAMQKMNLVFCQVPPPLRASFDKPFTLQAFLKAIGLKSYPFDSLSEGETSEIGRWIRSEIYTCVDNSSRSVVQGLPIWEGRQNNRIVLLPARDLEMLPQSSRRLSLEIFDGYTRPGIALAEFSHTLGTVLSWPPKRPSMTSERLAQLLFFPDALSVTNVNGYSNLLAAFLELGGAGSIPVPDGNLQFRQVDELYDHSVDLFSAALQSCARTHFLHPNFRHLNEQLRSKDLHFEIDWDAFLLCARTVNADLTIRQLPESDILTRAEVVYEVYGLRLPNIIMTNVTKWGQLNHLRFIPRNESRSTSSSYETGSYCEDLPEILAPSQLLLSQYERIAWSQRALFREEPTMNLVALNKSLGVPTAKEVVEHLAVLALRVAPEHPRNRTLLQQIRATYQWLNENSGAAREYLLGYSKTRALFLNVDDPDVEQWEWHSAEQMQFDIEYDYLETKTFKVRRFLQDYRPLLLAAGADSVQAVAYRPQGSAQDGNTVLREAFNAMRMEGQLTDMVLIPNEMDEGDDVEALRAHSTFLAAAIPHVRVALVNWREGGSKEYRFRGTYFGARAVLDFIYTGKIERDPGTSGDAHMTLLRDLLELLADTDSWDMPDLKDEIGRVVDELRLLSRDTYWMIFKEAEKYGATSLQKYCEDWGVKNPGSVARSIVDYAEDSE